MIKFLIILIFTLTVNISSACICPPMRLSDHQKEEIDNSEYIFIGEVIEVDSSTDTYKIKVLESFKNSDNEGVIYTGKNWKSCSPYIESKGKWLIYAKMENDYLRVNLCGISRSFENPQEIFNSIPPPLPEENVTEIENKIRREKWERKNKEKSKEDLANEIEALKERFN